MNTAQAPEGQGPWRTMKTGQETPHLLTAASFIPEEEEDEENDSVFVTSMDEPEKAIISKRSPRRHRLNTYPSPRGEQKRSKKGGQHPWTVLN